MAKNHKLIVFGIALILIGICWATIIGAVSASYYIDRDFKSFIYIFTPVLEFGMIVFPFVGFILIIAGCALKGDR